MGDAATGVLAPWGAARVPQRGPPAAAPVAP
eukprot:CAMPEP_0197896650 /NCGR_PEP_ID=MMETSP1439-20131203/40447_1 /TAXON_ID=66791 /ORGANISM="Gonyaulax spinifera, Strain CCMP409" /LENGTH=30 /DNA_ID= /DNA_START= /DNA_END= /DNA_ORIENTATION=